MEVRELAREWRIWVLLAGLLVSTLLLNPHYAEGEDGDIQLKTDVNDRLGIDFTGGTRLLLDMETNETGEEQLELAGQVRDILEVRLQQIGIADPNVRTVDIGGGQHRIQVEVGETNQSRIEDVIAEEGQFEARMPFRVDDEREFTLEEEHTFTRENGSITVDTTGESYNPGDRFTVEEGGPDIVYLNNTDEHALLEVTAYTGEDVQNVDSGTTEEVGDRYEWQFDIIISTSSAENLNRIAQNYQVSVGDGGWLIHDDGEYARMGLYVDGEEQSDLRMSEAFQTQVLTQSQVSGGGETLEDARQNMEEIRAYLQSGSLPVPVQIESITTVSSALGDDFLRASIISIIGALVAVGLLVTARYQDPRIAVPIILTGAAEVYIIMGVWFTTAGTLTLSAIAGIIAAVGTGVDDQIIITDESDREVIQSWTEKMKRAFFVIFTSAASTIGAMTPILRPGAMSLVVGAAGIGILGYNFYSRGSNRHFTAIGIFAALIGFAAFSTEPSGQAMATIHEFAFTTILGILIGITITRPAFAKVIEKMD